MGEGGRGSGVGAGTERRAIVGDNKDALHVFDERPDATLEANI